MSWSTFWIFSRLPESAAAEVEATLTEAVDRHLTREAREAVRAVERDPEVLLVKDRRHVNGIYGPFSGPCVPFGEEDIPDLAALLDLERNSILHVGLDRIPAAMAIFYSLGAARAGRLPGRFGNMVVPAERVAETRDQVRATFSEDPAVTLERARRILGSVGSSLQADDAPDVLGAIPTALDKAAVAGTGLVAFGLGV
jgi:hypothetical protein